MARRWTPLRWPARLVELAMLSGALYCPSAAAGDRAPLALVGSDATPVQAGETELYLEVRINGAPRGLARFIQREDGLWAGAETLRELGLRLPDGTPDPAPVDALSGIAARYDPRTQVLDLSAGPDRVALAPSVLGPGQDNPPAAEVSPGLVLNYDLYATWPGHGEPGLNALTRWRGFNGLGVLETSYLTYFGGGSERGWRGDSVRLDTTYTRAFPDAMVRLRVGDTITGGVSWSRPVRIGGIQLARDFSLQPYRITTPMPGFLGSAALPSAVELYVNGVQQYDGEVPAGPFRIDAPPTITGSGTAQVVLTDALGRVTTLDFPIYASHQLLQAGLSDWSFEMGRLRRGYGLENDGYAPGLVGSGTWRRGVSSRLTLEAHAEGGRGVRNGGLGAVVQLGRRGVLDAAVAWGRLDDSRGRQVSAGYRWDSPRLHFALQGTRADAGYRDLASLDPDTRRIRETAHALFGVNGTRLGSLGVSYTHLRYEDEDANRYAGVHWSRPFGRRVTASLQASQNLDDHDDRMFAFRLSVRLDGNVSVGAGWRHDRDGGTRTVSAMHWPSGDDRGGWRALLRDGPHGTDGSVDANWRGVHADLTAGVRVDDDTRIAHAGATGAVVLMGGQPFFARRIDDGFAVVSTSGIAGVPVQLENQPVGRTNERGLLLVSPLRAYERNAIGIDPSDLPADLRVAGSRLNATPSDRAGTVVEFAIEPVRAAVLVLHGAGGEPLPLGAQARLEGGDEAAIVGFEGEVYLEHLQPGANALRVHWTDGACSLRFDYPEGDGPLPRIGPLACTPKERP